MKAVFKSDRGKIRPINEDFCYVKYYGQNILCVVADGMGGHKSGEVASKLAADTVIETFDQMEGDLVSEEKIVECLKRSVETANTKVFEHSIHNAQNCGMGTTLVVLCGNETMVYVANVGDSRAYYVKDKSIKQITNDHSVVGDLLRSGTITPKQARNHPQKNIITKAIGTERNIDPDYFALKFETGDHIIICTDGLSNMVEDYEIADIVSQSIPLENKADALIELANEKDGYDNISVVIIA